MLNVFNQSIWGDEGFSAILSMKSVPEIISIIIRDTSPPLWNLVEHLAFQIFGVSEATIRGLALLFFIATAVFVYLFVSRFFGKASAVLATLLTILNPFFFIYAFEGRMYSIMALGIAASMYFFLRKKWTPYVLATLWALYSHHFAIFPIILQGMWFLYELFSFQFTSKKDKKTRRASLLEMFKAFIFVGIGYLPWILPLYNQTKMVGGGFWLGTPTLTDLRNLIYEYLAEGNRNLGLTLPILKNITFHQFALYITLAIILLRKWHKNIKVSAFLLIWFLGPILMAFFVSQKFQSIFYNRYLLYTIPAAMIILTTERRRLSTVLIVVLIFLFSFIDYYYFTHPTKLRFKELGAYVQETRNPDDFFINWNAGSHHLWETKFYGFDSPIYIPSGGELPFFVGTALMNENDIVRSIPESTKRVGVTTSGNIDEITLPGYTESETKILGNLKFVWYEKN